MQLLDRSFDVSTTAVSTVQMSLEAQRAVEQFLFHEARLLDERRFDQWLALWDEDGRYWVPRFHGQTNPFEQISLFWEDARIDFGDAFRGDRAAFMPFVKALEESYVRRMHMFGEPRIQLEGSDAQVEVASVTHVRAAASPGRMDNVVYGRYLLGLQKRKGEWRLSSLLYLLNYVASASTTESDAGPLNSAENTTMAHPQAPKF